MPRLGTECKCPQCDLPARVKNCKRNPSRNTILDCIVDLELVLLEGGGGGGSLSGDHDDAGHRQQDDGETTAPSKRASQDSTQSKENMPSQAVPDTSVDIIAELPGTPRLDAKEFAVETNSAPRKPLAVVPSSAKSSATTTVPATPLLSMDFHPERPPSNMTAKLMAIEISSNGIRSTPSLDMQGKLPLPLLPSRRRSTSSSDQATTDGTPLMDEMIKSGRMAVEREDGTKTPTAVKEITDLMEDHSGTPKWTASTMDEEATPERLSLPTAATVTHPHVDAKQKRKSLPPPRTVTASVQQPKAAKRKPPSPSKPLTTKRSTVQTATARSATAQTTTAQSDTSKPSRAGKRRKSDPVPQKPPPPTISPNAIVEGHNRKPRRKSAQAATTSLKSLYGFTDAWDTESSKRSTNSSSGGSDRRVSFQLPEMFTAGPPKQEWSCEACTLLNPSWLKRCKVCGHKRTVGVALVSGKAAVPVIRCLVTGINTDVNVTRRWGSTVVTSFF